MTACGTAAAAALPLWRRQTELTSRMRRQYVQQLSQPATGLGFSRPSAAMPTGCRGLLGPCCW
jgi:ribosomal protein L32E